MIHTFGLLIITHICSTLCAFQEAYIIFGAFLAMVLADVLAIFNIIGAEKAFHWRKLTKSFICPLSHYYLVILFGTHTLQFYANWGLDILVVSWLERSEPGHIHCLNFLHLKMLIRFNQYICSFQSGFSLSGCNYTADQTTPFSLNDPFFCQTG